jgi:hypothetical protein
MTRQELLNEAATLRQPSEDAAAEYARHGQTLAERVSAALSSRPDLLRLVGEGNQEMMRDNHRNHARFMASLFGRYSAEVLVETVLWVFRAYRAHGFALTYWPAQLNSWLEAMREILSPETYAAVAPFYEWLLLRQPAFAALSDQEPVAWEGAPSHGGPSPGESR